MATATAMTQAADSGPKDSSIGPCVFSPAQGETVRVLDVETVWDHTVCHVWVPRKYTVDCLAAEALPSRAAPGVALGRFI